MFYWLVPSDLLIIMPSDECHRTLLMISQQWFRWWLGAVRQQAITWSNVDSIPCRLMASLGHNELTWPLPAVHTFHNQWNENVGHFDEIFITGCIESCHYCQLLAQPVMKISSKWWHFCFTDLSQWLVYRTTPMGQGFLFMYRDDVLVNQIFGFTCVNSLTLSSIFLFTSRVSCFAFQPRMVTIFSVDAKTIPTPWVACFLMPVFCQVPYYQ